MTKDMDKKPTGNSTKNTSKRILWIRILALEYVKAVLRYVVMEYLIGYVLNQQQLENYRQQEVVYKLFRHCPNLLNIYWRVLIDH